MIITYEIAMAAGQDAGNRSMRAAGSTKWSRKDWSVARDETSRLWTPETARQRVGGTFGS